MESNDTSESRCTENIDADQPEVADRSWIGREAMVTYDNGCPWYDGKITRITEGGDYVQVLEEVVKGRLWKRTVLEATWHDVDVVYLIDK